MPTAPRGSLPQRRGAHDVVLLQANDRSRRVAEPLLERAPARGAAAFHGEAEACRTGRLPGGGPAE
eukprot:9480068-Pyramimonas_sp.AAC.1